MVAHAYKRTHKHTHINADSFYEIIDVRRIEHTSNTAAAPSGCG